MINLVAENKLLSACLGLLVFLMLVAIFDIFVAAKKHTIMHNFPVVGRLRYWLEMIGPEMRQYWVANDKEEMPFNRDERSWIFASAKSQNNVFGFDTTGPCRTIPSKRKEKLPQRTQRSQRKLLLLSISTRHRSSTF